VADRSARALAVNEFGIRNSEFGMRERISEFRIRTVRANIISLALGPHPQRELTLMRERRLCMAVALAWPQALSLALGPHPGSPPRQPRWGPRPQRELTLMRERRLCMAVALAWPQALMTG